MQKLRADNVMVVRDEWSLPPVSFELDLGDALIVRGGNGAGKTSLLRCLVGLLPVFSGEIWSDPIIEDSCHYLGHPNALKPSLTVEQNLTFFCGFFSSPSSSVGEALERMNLTPLSSVLVSNLSSGQMRCVALCRLLLASRPFWFLDEPTTGLDESAESLVCDLIEEHRKTGIVVVSTHRPLNLNNPKILALGVN